MTNLEFNNRLYANETEMLDVAVQAYMSAFGASDEKFVSNEFAAHTDEVLASDMERHWPEVRADHSAILAAFARNRASFPKWVINIDVCDPQNEHAENPFA
jgi:hypothetical protein